MPEKLSSVFCEIRRGQPDCFKSPGDLVVPRDDKHALWRPLVLEVQLQGQLAQSRILRLGDLAEGAHRRTTRGQTPSSAEADATRRDELRMVEEIEEFCTEFQIHTLRNRCVLVERQVPVIDSRSMEK